MVLSTLKQKSVNEKIKDKLILINELKLQKNIDEEGFKNSFSNLTAVWKIFLLHIIKPEFYPIYDQHIHRAYNFINKLEYKNISVNINNKEKERFYFDEYLPFVHNIKGVKLKKLDEAFFSFGQFIKSYHKLAE